MASLSEFIKNASDESLDNAVSTAMTIAMVCKIAFTLCTYIVLKFYVSYMWAELWLVIMYTLCMLKLTSYNEQNFKEYLVKTYKIPTDETKENDSEETKETTGKDPTLES